MPPNAVTVTAYFETISISGAIEISTPDGLDNVRYNLAGDYVLTADISLSEYSNWVPIGTQDDPFTGKINGNGKVIFDLKTNGTTELLTGLFGYVFGGEIIDFTLEEVDVNGGTFTGAIAGAIDDSTITGCSISGKITSLSSSGGVAGSVNYSVITNCHSTCEISSAIDAGGIAGQIYNSTVTNSSSTGVIKSYSDSGESGASGGISGYVENSMIAGCFSSGNIVSESHISVSGGIAGGVTYYSEIIDSYSTGDIEAYTDSTGPGSASGGIAGYVWNGSITNSYSTGNINSSYFSGGIAGSVEGEDEITNCAAINETISADHDAGRIIGSISFPGSSTISNNIALTSMVATGTVDFDVTDVLRHGITKSDSDLKSQSTYSDELGWGFNGDDTEPWWMSADGYPILYWQ